MKRIILMCVFLLAPAVLRAQAGSPIPKIVQLPNAIKLEYVERGREDGVPVVLLHGITDSWRSFSLTMPLLPDSMHVFAVSLRGHGNSDRPAAGYEPDRFASDLAAFLDKVKVKKAVIVGHSMGSMVAQRFAMLYPERTRGLVLMASWTTLAGNQEMQKFYTDWISTLSDPVDPTFARDFQMSTMARPVAPEFVDGMVQESLKAPARVWRGSFEGLLRADFSADLKKINAPTLVMFASKDSYCKREEQDALVAAIRGAQLMVYEGSGHALHWEDPQRFATDLAAFVAKLPAK